MPDTLLIIEDEVLLGTELQRHYRRQGWNATWVKSRAEAERELGRGTAPLVVLSDLQLPDGNGLDILEQARSEEDRSEWIFLTGYGDVPDSVRAIKLGAYDFLTKPCEQARLDLVLNGAARSARAQRRIKDESQARGSRYGLDAFLGRSPAARGVRDMLGRLAGLPWSGLILSGETGTGKGLAARVLHHAGSRADGPLVEINCAALPHELMEAELFGHEAGAYTGAKGMRRGLVEQAHGGTLFLDEIGELALDLQAKLLKVIEDKKLRRLGSEREIPVDIQILAATNRDLATEAQAGRFRADLYHRLSVFRLELPPLRSRREDLHDLVPRFVDEFNALAGKRVSNIPDAVWQRLAAYDWPGNVRELRNVVERSVLLSSGDSFPLEWLQLAPAQHTSASSASGDSLTLPLDGSLSLDEMVGRLIQATLDQHGHNVTEVARVLKTTRDKIRYRIDKLGICSDV
ncbi:MAG: sigma-54-dependent Fis family transcriptional regulator [Thiobacillus sp.]|nr:sigma-54-dependent Fis family transcriptional regulator [Thiobacillus sp.]